MLDLTVVILTKDEELHIGRCLEKLRPLNAKRIVIVDCFSTDTTKDIAIKYGAEVVEHTWPGNQAEQFNWAIDHLDITTQWILRVDADEYLLPELLQEFTDKLPTIDESVSGVMLRRRHIFMGRWMKRGIYPVKLLRLFRNGYGRSEHRLMDEHIALSAGKCIEFENDFCDHNLNDLSWFCNKHICYAIREAAEYLNEEYSLDNNCDDFTSGNIVNQAAYKRKLKSRYNSLPLFWRAAAYFLYRYVAKGAFLEGKEGFLFSFIQGWWYRTLVDAKILEIKRKSSGDPEGIKRILREEYNIGF